MFNFWFKFLKNKEILQYCDKIKCNIGLKKDSIKNIVKCYTYMRNKVHLLKIKLPFTKVRIIAANLLLTEKSQIYIIKLKSIDW